MKLSLVIPAYNESQIIERTVVSALKYLDGRFSELELIVSDDGSTDDTRALVERLGDAQVRVVSHMPNRGKGSAVREGILAATGDVIVCTDADLAYGLEPISALAALIVSGAELAVGSRKLHPNGYADYPALRLAASRIFSFFTERMAGFSYDTQCGIKAYSRKAAQEIFSRCKSDGFAFDFEVLMLADKLGVHVVQYPVSIVNQRDSKVCLFRDSFRMLRDVGHIKRSIKEHFQ